METIIYVYPLKELNRKQQKQINNCVPQPHVWNRCSMEQEHSMEQECFIEDWNMADYHLVRVGISRQLAQICGGNQSQKEVAQTESVSGKRKQSFWTKRRWKKEQKVRMQREQELLTKFLQMIWWDPEQSMCVCEEKLPFFNRWEFNGYFETNWVKHMLRYVMSEEKQGFVFSHVLVLGQAQCLTELLFLYAGKMKSLKWVLPARQFREEQQEVVEDIYDEYGLAVDVQLLEDEDAYRRTRVSCVLPTVVLDFSESDRVPTADIAKGSLWLDMASSEQKRRRIEDRNTGIQYFSLKKEWKHPQKALFYLDTISKNGYNT